MGTKPLDVQGVLSELQGPPEPSKEFDRATRLGHMHLHEEGPVVRDPSQNALVLTSAGEPG